MTGENPFDVLIIGGGGAGMTAALYASRAKLSTVLFEKMTPGGQIATTDVVENYPGFPEGITGPEIAARMEDQARRYGTQIVFKEIKALSRSAHLFEVRTAKEIFSGKAVVLACGASFRMLQVPGERELTGRGVSYCATCDGAFFKDKEIIVVGGGDSALQESLFLTRFASRVTVVHRRDQLRASPILQERAKKDPKIGFLWDSVIEKIEGPTKVSGVALRNVKTQALTPFRTDGVFIFIGHTPNSSFLQGFVDCDDKGYVKVTAGFETSVKGVFAAGEIRQGAVRQLVSACGDGCGAALAAQAYLDE
ncbi:MAG: thioredoxin-disulfide reductase [Candidatus Omnitrophota bacterium]|jgi:thioredoxin reductase (NADPH)